MLYIMMRNPDYESDKKAQENLPPIAKVRIIEMTWNVGRQLPFPLNDHNVHEVVAVQADGDELDYIKRVTERLPMMSPQWRVQTWRGENAQFIVDTIRHDPNLRKKKD